MRLFFNQTSPYARKVRIAIHELGLRDAVEFIEVDPWREPHDLTEVNPLSKVPALVLADGSVVTESDTIIQALHSLTAGLQPIPDHEPERRLSLARVALCQGLIDASFICVVEARRPPELRWADWITRQERVIARTLSSIEARFALDDRRFDIGDIGLASGLGYLDFRNAHLSWRSGRPRLAEWFERAELRPSMIATRPC
ncbi:glutathione S-transferase family protein [Tardiphaga sp. 42S5]|uniref:glutathione S-transferase family protein n=1 Tax=Tardiphaga sp. 42S5 TaxID=1404799 RepID=UPI002A5AC3B5|nr:glutathione S-transferase family protein [Tardiphaga sp. 42S5]WPO39458.1 glutathione S-transferase family protein [Tardiphaga sp. 42S5]